jgi:hypothetical protein
MALIALFASEFYCFGALPALPFGNIYKSRLYLGHIVEFERQKKMQV